MKTTTIEDQLAVAQDRIRLLNTLAQASLVADRARINRHLDALSREATSVRAALNRGVDEAEAKLGQLWTRLAVAENSLAAELSEDWPSFADAVEDELRSWDTFLERLQTTTAEKKGETREQVEAAIADVRTRRIAVYDALVQTRERVNGAWHEQRRYVSSAREDLERKADGLSATLN